MRYQMITSVLVNRNKQLQDVILATEKGSHEPVEQPFTTGVSNRFIGIAERWIPMLLSPCEKSMAVEALFTPGIAKQSNLDRRRATLAALIGREQTGIGNLIIEHHRCVLLSLVEVVKAREMRSEEEGNFAYAAITMFAHPEIHLVELGFVAASRRDTR